MQLGLVVGHATATVKHPTLVGQRLLIVQLLGVDERADGEPVLAVDTLGAWNGSRVMMTTDAVQIREMTGSKNSPLRWSVQALCDT